MAGAKGQNSAATQYAQALLELANERGMAEAIGGELAQLKALLDANETFELFLKDPAIGEAERQQVLDRAFKGQVSELLFNTLGVMNAKGRLGLVRELADSYAQLLDKQLGNVKVDVTVASSLDEAMLEQVRNRVSQSLGKNAILRQHIDPSIIGGLLLRVEDKLIDSSVRSQLDAMKRQMMAAAPNR